LLVAFEVLPAFPALLNAFTDVPLALSDGTDVCWAELMEANNKVERARAMLVLKRRMERSFHVID
jgi:hypothetical protein